MTKREIKKLLKLHKLWLDGNPNGKRLEIHDESLVGADLGGADLHGANLRGANLSYADLHDSNLSKANLNSAGLCGANLIDAFLYDSNLRYADLTSASLNVANLRDANLNGAKLNGADLGGAALHGARLIKADLSGANLNDADLRGADLSGADLGGADITDVKISSMTAGYSMACPSEGPYIAWKKCGAYIVKLLIPEKAKRSSATTLKCRASAAKVLEIQTKDGSKANIKSVHSDYDDEFIYTVGKTVKVKDFDTNRWNECSTGIHHFLDRDQAVQYD